MPVSILIMLLAILMFSGTAFAGRPLITDDANTQGKGKYQLQIGGEYSRNDNDDLQESQAHPKESQTPLWK